jgi:DUF2934 family protein
MARKRINDNDLVVSSSAAAAPVRRKAAAKPRAKHSATPAESLAPTPESDVIEASTVTVYEPSHEEIACLAYLYWEARGYQGGSPEEDWLRAQQELRVRASAATA